MGNDHKKGYAYVTPNSENWTGRQTNNANQIDYWYQKIELIEWTDESFKMTADNCLGLIGYASDEGARRNQGRIGSVEGPTAIRQQLAKVALHHETRIVDFGDIKCVDNNMEASQVQFANSISRLIQLGIMPFALGGSHDMAFASFKGAYNAIKAKDNKRIGIINFDAHFDLRPVVQQANSGTPFNEIATVLADLEQEFKYMAIGIQPQSNTKELYQIAAQHQVEYIHHDDCELSNISQIKAQLDLFMATVDHLYISIDIDSFSSAYAPGVSAPSPLGFDPNFFFKVFEHLLKSNKVILCDIAELNPAFDRDNCTAKLASRIVDFAAGVL